MQIQKKPWMDAVLLSLFQGISEASHFKFTVLGTSVMRVWYVDLFICCSIATNSLNLLVCVKQWDASHLFLFCFKVILHVGSIPCAFSVKAKSPLQPISLNLFSMAVKWICYWFTLHLVEDWAHTKLYFTCALRPEYIYCWEIQKLELFMCFFFYFSLADDVF